MRLAAWAELLLISILVPESSFVGHLAGIFAGTIYIWLDRILSKANTSILDLLRDIFLGTNFKGDRGARTTENAEANEDFGSFFSNLFSQFMTGNFNIPGFNTAAPQYNTDYDYQDPNDRYYGYGSRGNARGGYY